MLEKVSMQDMAQGSSEGQVFLELGQERATFARGRQEVIPCAAYVWFRHNSWSPFILQDKWMNGSEHFANIGTDRHDPWDRLPESYTCLWLGSLFSWATRLPCGFVPENVEKDISLSRFDVYSHVKFLLPSLDRNVNGGINMFSSC